MIITHNLKSLFFFFNIPQHCFLCGRIIGKNYRQITRNPDRTGSASGAGTAKGLFSRSLVCKLWGINIPIRL